MVSGAAASLGKTIMESQRERIERELSRPIPRVVSDPDIPAADRALLSYRFDRAVPASRTPGAPHRPYLPPAERLDSIRAAFLISVGLAGFVFLGFLFTPGFAISVVFFVCVEAFLVLVFWRGWCL